MRVSFKLVLILVVSLSLLIDDEPFGHGPTIEFGVYSETIGGCILYDAPDTCCRDGTYNSSGSIISVYSDFTDPPEGSEYLVFEIDVLAGGWTGWFIQWGAEWNEGLSTDMSAYTNGYLKFLVKTAIDLSIGVRSNNITPGDESSTVRLSDYCEMNDQWHDVSIPIADFLSEDARLDLTRMKILFNVTVAENTGGTESFWIDNVRWTVTVPSNIFITSVKPDRALNSGTVVDTIFGGGFQSGTCAMLVQDHSVIQGINTVALTSNMITTAFDLTGVDTGNWDVIVTDPGEQSDTLTAGFEVRFYKPPSTGPVTVIERHILIDGATYSIKGVGYAPTPIGEAPWSWSFPDHGVRDTLIYHRDFDLLQQMHCNTIRTWGQVTGELLDKADEYGLKVLCGFWVDTDLDLEDQLVRNSVISNFRTYVNTFKDYPAVLMWSIGNEQNYQNGNNPAWYSLVNEMAREAYEEEGESYHPVTSPNGDIYNIGDRFMEADDISMNYLDAWGANVYSGISFGDLFERYSVRSTKPFWISEYGIDAWDHQNKREYPEIQALYVTSLWSEMETNADICAGGTIMAYCDEWWKNGNPYDQEPGGYPTPNHPDGWSDEEYYGIMWVEDNGNNPDIMHPREVYYSLQNTWETFEMRGDVNSDGEINVLDVLAVVNHILGTTQLNSEALLRADCKADGEINVLDAVGIVNVILGLGRCEP